MIILIAIPFYATIEARLGDCNRTVDRMATDVTRRKLLQNGQNPFLWMLEQSMRVHDFIGQNSSSGVYSNHLCASKLQATSNIATKTAAALAVIAIRNAFLCMTTIVG
jgi:hypothetical protein